MSSSSHGPSNPGTQSRNLLDALESITITGSSTASSVPGKLEIMSKAMLAPFSHRKTDSTRILADRMFKFFPLLNTSEHCL